VVTLRLFPSVCLGEKGARLLYLAKVLKCSSYFVYDFLSSSTANYTIMLEMWSVAPKMQCVILKACCTDFSIHMCCIFWRGAGVNIHI